MATLEQVRHAHERLSAWFSLQPRDWPDHPFGDANWTYDGDRHVEAATPLPVVFMGFNPGFDEEADHARLNPSERAWRTRSTRVARTTADRVVYAELICLPTRDQRGLRADRSRIREMMSASLELNLAIVSFHQPKVVFQAGLTRWHLDLVEELYGLTFQRLVSRPEGKRGTLARIYSLPSGIPWIAFRHFAAPGFSDEDRALLQAVAEELGWAGTDQPLS